MLRSPSLESLLELDHRQTSGEYRVLFQLQQSPLIAESPADTPRSILKKCCDHSPVSSNRAVQWERLSSSGLWQKSEGTHYPLEIIRHRVSFSDHLITAQLDARTPVPANAVSPTQAIANSPISKTPRVSRTKRLFRITRRWRTRSIDKVMPSESPSAQLGCPPIPSDQSPLMPDRASQPSLAAEEPPFRRRHAKRLTSWRISPRQAAPLQHAYGVSATPAGPPCTRRTPTCDHPAEWMRGSEDTHLSRRTSSGRHTSNGVWSRLMSPSGFSARHTSSGAVSSSHVSSVGNSSGPAHSNDLPTRQLTLRSVFPRHASSSVRSRDLTNSDCNSSGHDSCQVNSAGCADDSCGDEYLRVWSKDECDGPVSPISSQLTTATSSNLLSVLPEVKVPSERIFFNSLDDLREFSPELKHKIPIGLYEFAFLDAHLPENGRDKKWEFVGAKGSTRMYKQINTVNGSDLIMVKGYATIDVDIQTILFNIRDTPRRTAWDTTFDGFTLVEGNVQDNEIVFNSIKAPWPIADRGFLQWRRTIIDEKSGIIKILHRSAEHPAYPEDTSSSMIRAESIISAYILTPRGRDQTDLFLLTQTDIKGLIPRWMVNAASAKTPFAWIENLRKACHETRALKRPIPAYSPKPLYLSGVPVGAR